MEPVISARHCDISESLRERALGFLDRLGALAHRPVDAAVVFATDAGQHQVELRLHVSHGEVLVANGTAADHRSALDRAEEKLRKQLERLAGRVRDARHSLPDLKQI